jgi:hypothetical protein
VTPARTPRSWKVVQARNVVTITDGSTAYLDNNTITVGTGNDFRPDACDDCQSISARSSRVG